MAEIPDEENSKCTRFIRLNNKSRNDFERGSTDDFYILVDNDLDVSLFYLKHEKKLIADDWILKRLKIEGKNFLI